MKEIIKIVQALRTESSTNGKIAILQKNKDNGTLKKVLLYTYDPFRKYGINNFTDDSLKYSSVGKGIEHRRQRIFVVIDERCLTV